LWSIEDKKANLRDERQREKGEGAAGNADLSLALEENILFILVFFSSVILVELGQVGSVQSVSNFENQNRTELKMFCDFLIG
jgi:hypothetical protein